MITILNDAPENVAAFNATGEITREDFENLVIPHVKSKVEQFDELNYLLYLNTDLDNFTMGAWLQDALLGIKNITKWNRVAIVTDKDGVQNFTDIFSVLMPGEFKSFPKENLYNALYWCQNGNEVQQ
ncbi:STAS/SEC14 domain-containing protein [Chryseobacterium sp. Ch-15]|uniref:STAS/SEC14 domain-containing protein n=1 Tax=Chryseobacterium muglaense TaxID=2893752 RepID=A0A9Q3UUU7_9FLAO|nr:STAS/SEC14 domain-containing protein [Chryseobacterium muglaense]MBD3907008.1 STAS/SEC14 domain-containing protein [Chryseobacterium muglaense]MCC9034140.1 STAS/SEC14 domain-containing protein [Chryseobacterium muglaense]MCM2556723.1 STAS/SEC14 domain-containing protein [Chryseobacterium muglaense]